MGARQNDDKTQVFNVNSMSYEAVDFHKNGYTYTNDTLKIDLLTPAIYTNYQGVKRIIHIFKDPLPIFTGVSDIVISHNIINTNTKYELWEVD